MTLPRGGRGRSAASPFIPKEQLVIVPDPWDYGEDKTREQEARDSMQMLAVVIVAALVAIAGIVVAIVLAVR